jgi:hypothetical protein
MDGQVKQILNYFTPWIGTPYPKTSEGTEWLPEEIGNAALLTKGPTGKVDCSHLLLGCLYDAGYKWDYLYTQALWSRGKLRRMQDLSDVRSYELPMFITRYAVPFMNLFNAQDLCGTESAYAEPYDGLYAKSTIPFNSFFDDKLEFLFRQNTQTFVQADLYTTRILNTMNEKPANGNAVVRALILEVCKRALAVFLRAFGPVGTTISIAISVATAAQKLDEYFRDFYATGNALKEESEGHVIYINPVNGLCIESAGSEVLNSGQPHGVQGWFRWSDRSKELQDKQLTSGKNIDRQNWLSVTISNDSATRTYSGTFSTQHFGLTGSYFGLDVRRLRLRD